MEGCVREGGSGGGMCDGGEERWRDVRQIGRREDRSRARERNKRLLTPVSKCAYNLVPQQRRVFGQLQCPNTKLSMFLPIHLDQVYTADLGPPYPPPI